MSGRGGKKSFFAVTLSSMSLLQLGFEKTLSSEKGLHLTFFNSPFSPGSTLEGEREIGFF